ncbi:MAG: MBL fold metallo-hydrolase [Candidatus Cryptobacteroides sp.]
MYLLEDDVSDKVWLVDIGTTILPIPKGKKVAGVFITHTHIDHIQGVNALLERYPDCVLYTSEEGKRGLYDDKINLTFYHEEPLCYNGGEIHLIREGDTIPLFDTIKMQVMETPGHHPSCLSFKADKWLFTGDSFIPDKPVVTKLKGGNREQAKQSRNRLLSIIDGGMIVCPGHGKIYWNIDCYEKLH